MSVKGYKAFNPDFTCRNTKFAENETFEVPLPIKICNNGIHFCLKASHVFSYYQFDPNNIICEVEAIGEVQYHEDDSKACTNILKIGKRLTWAEVLAVANEGAHNTGHSNTGDRNTGYRNTGDRNTGDRNTGDWNTGDRNTGYRNTGDWNTGDRNTGDSNTGDWNTGDRNTGYSNTGDRNTGAFCTGKKYLDFFDKPSDLTEEEFRESKAFSLLCEVDTKLWVHSYQMTDDEKSKYPSHKTAEGYLKDIPFKQAFQDRWHNWNESNRDAFRQLPNFDAVIFETITGVKP